MSSTKDIVAYVDIDDTLVRSFGAKRIPLAAMIRHVRHLHGAGVALFAWSTAGADYARAAAVELGLEGCFQTFLPKPHVTSATKRQVAVALIHGAHDSPHGLPRRT